jgi:serine/threonine protein kinase
MMEIFRLQIPAPASFGHGMAEVLRTYTPPELSLWESLSRAGDIWSLGCIFLEFIVWLLEGPDALEVFAQDRTTKSLDRMVTDIFYTISGIGADRYAKVKPEVLGWLDGVKVKIPSDGRSIRGLLEVVQDNMLQVNPEDRMTAESLERIFSKMLEKAGNNP